MPEVVRVEAVAAVLFEAPHGTDGLVLGVGQGAEFPFGRAAACPIRFGYAPTMDAGLARRAGSFLVAGGRRLVVEASAEAGHLPLQVRVPGKPPVELAPGEAFAPQALEYTVVVRGDREWPIVVRTRRHEAPHPDPPPADERDPVTRRPHLHLDAAERALLEAYLAPVRFGGLEPASHREVADALHYSPNKVRNDLYGLWSKLVAEGLPVPDYADKRVAVMAAVLANGIR